MKKRLIYVMILISLILSALSGCGKKEDFAADVYLDIAQGYVDEGDYSSAVDALKKGYEATKDNRIAAMIAELVIQMGEKEETESTELVEEPKVSPTEKPTVVPTEATDDIQLETASNKENNVENYSQFSGSWSERDASWEQGGMLMDIKCTDKTITINLSYVQSAPMNRVAEFEVQESLANISDKELIVKFYNDGWGNTGTACFYFDNSDHIECRIIDMVISNTALWGFCEKTFDLYRNDVISGDLSYDANNVLDDNLLDNQDNQKRINIFLSNFAEQRCSQYPFENDYQLLYFAYVYSTINSNSLITYDEYCAYMNKGDVDDILNRFFGRTVIPSDNSMIFYPNYGPGDFIAYGANQYQFIAATGEYRGYVAVASDMIDNGDGTYTVWFDTYMVSMDSQTDYSEYYGMSIEEAESDGRLSLYQHGQAIVKDYTRSNGKETYQLIEYRVY